MGRRSDQGNKPHSQAGLMWRQYDKGNTCHSHAGLMG
jgi:hypothetical protein